MAPARIAVIGTSGAGKTTLGRELARRLGAVFVEVDALQHKAGWVKASAEEIGAGIRAALARPDIHKIVRLRTPQAIERWLAGIPRTTPRAAAG